LAPILGGEDTVPKFLDQDYKIKHATDHAAKVAAIGCDLGDSMAKK